MDNESDVDIAVLADRSLDLDERRTLRMHCLSRLLEACPAIEEKFDVVVLQDVPTLLRYNVIRKGRRISERDRSQRVNFEIDTERAYEDEEPYLRRESEMILQQILRPNLSHPAL